MSSSSDEEPTVVRRRKERPTRTTGGGGGGKKTALDKLKSGVRNTYDESTYEPVYDEVDEEKYSAIVRKRQLEDWIEEDGTGYAEDGREIFDEEEQEEKKKKSKPSTSKPALEEGKEGAQSKGIKSFFSNAVAASKAKRTKEQETAPTDDCMQAALADLLNTVVPLQQAVQPPSPVNHVQSTTTVPPPQPLTDAAPCPPPLTDDSPSPPPSPPRPATQKREASSPLKAISPTKPPPHKHAKPAPRIAVVKPASEVRAVPESNAMTETPLTIAQPLSLSTADATECSMEDLPTDDAGDLPFYFVDAFEDAQKHAGTVYMFGRVWLRGRKEWVSGCLVLQNLERVVYVLPRRTNGDGAPVTEDDVYDELQTILGPKFGIRQFRAKMVKRRAYVFDDVDYSLVSADEDGFMSVMELRYKAVHRALPADCEGRTFCHVFGTTATPLELLLMHGGIRGTGWLRVRRPVLASPPVSYCKVELTVNGGDDVSTWDVGKSPLPADVPLSPTLSMAAINVVTAINARTKCNEIVAIAMLYNAAVPLDRPMPSPKFTHQTCIVCKPSDASMPFDLADKMRERGGMQSWVVTVANERALLNVFLARLQRFDPDLLLGHDLKEEQLATIVNRLSYTKATMWSRLSRLKRSSNPPKMTTSTSKQIRWEVTAGRIVCDSRVAADEFVRCRSLDLTELTVQLLPPSRTRTEVLPGDVLPSFGSSDTLIHLIRCAMNDADLAIELLNEMNAIPLFTQITSIVGGVLSRTWTGGRAERNAYLLMHAFHGRQHLIPDKARGHEGDRKGHANDTTKSSATTAKQGRKPQYAGGLVLEPKKGLYNTYILLLDFNSLYPSIIQEYNICFTTVDRSTIGEEDGIPQLPASKQDTGILPEEIRRLVNRRREVKKLMKAEGVGAEQLGQLNIRQLALKLTANSMYGCLGTGFSRFQAKHLAALVTSKGREILQLTVEHMERMGYSVVYGDTDSIMINTMSHKLGDVDVIGRRVIDDVNKMFKQLELAVDGVYRSFLLLKKKKYAGMMVSRTAKGAVEEKMEMKGLDMVRRDWSCVAKEAGEQVLRHILSDEPLDTVLSNVTTYLSKLGDDVREGHIDKQLYVISKALTRNPREYADAKSQAHVTVALRMNEEYHSTYKMGDTVSYVICLDGSSSSAMQRAYHVREMEKHSYPVDKEYYLAQQIHAVVARLIEPIDGIDAAVVAECLGLDAKQYKARAQHIANRAEGEEEDDLEDVPLVEPLLFACPECQHENVITTPTVTRNNSLAYAIGRCTSCSYAMCSSPCRLRNQLALLIKRHVKRRLYGRTMQCDDCSSPSQTVRVSALGGESGKCVVCAKGSMINRSNDNISLVILKQWQRLLSPEYIRSKLTDAHRAEVRDAVVEKAFNEHLGRLLHAEIVTNNAYNDVCLSSIFARIDPAACRRAVLGQRQRFYVATSPQS